MKESEQLRHSCIATWLQRRVGLTSKREIVVRKNTCKAFAEVLSNILACFNKKPFLSAICHDFGSPGSKASLRHSSTTHCFRLHLQLQAPPRRRKTLVGYIIITAPSICQEQQHSLNKCPKISLINSTTMSTLNKFVFFHINYFYRS